MARASGASEEVERRWRRRVMVVRRRRIILLLFMLIVSSLLEGGAGWPGCISSVRALSFTLLHPKNCHFLLAVGGSLAGVRVEKRRAGPGKLLTTPTFFLFYVHRYEERKAEHYIMHKSSIE